MQDGCRLWFGRAGYQGVSPVFVFGHEVFLIRNQVLTHAMKNEYIQSSTIPDWATPFIQVNARHNSIHTRVARGTSTLPVPNHQTYCPLGNTPPSTSS